MLIDSFGQFERSDKTCRKCGWTGKGAEMTSGDSFGDGIEKNCPRCDHYYGFVAWSIVVSDMPPADWKATIGRVEL